LLLPVSKINFVENSVAYTLPLAQFHITVDCVFTATEEGFDRAYTLTLTHRPFPPKPATIDSKLSFAYNAIMTFIIIYPFGVFAVLLFYLSNYTVFTKRYSRQNPAEQAKEEMDETDDWILLDV